jgi:hypothetical protein
VINRMATRTQQRGDAPGERCIVLDHQDSHGFTR